MTWTYTKNLTVPRDYIRFLIGDTDKTSQKLSDEEIAGLLAANDGDGVAAAAEGAESLAAFFADMRTENVGDLENNRLKTDNYLKIARKLRARIETGDESDAISVFAGGLRRSNTFKQGDCGETHRG